MRKGDFEIALEYGRLTAAAHRVYRHSPRFLRIPVKERQSGHGGNHGHGLIAEEQEVSAIGKSRYPNGFLARRKHTGKEIAFRASVAVEIPRRKKDENRERPRRPHNERDGRAFYEEAVSFRIFCPEK